MKKNSLKITPIIILGARPSPVERKCDEKDLSDYVEFGSANLIFIGLNKNRANRSGYDDIHDCRKDIIEGRNNGTCGYGGINAKTSEE